MTKQQNQQALLITCPVCFSTHGMKCTLPTGDGQQETNIIHHKRVDLVEPSQLSTERHEFLTSIIEEGLHYGSWWEIDAIVRDGKGNILVAEVRDEDGERHYITPHSITAAFRRIGSGQVKFYNPGYREEVHGKTSTRFNQYDRSNGMESDLDAIDYDALIQVAVFNGELVYG